MALRYVVHEDQITPEIRTKIQALARILAEQRPTPGQVHALLRLVAKDTGFPVSAVRAVLALAKGPQT